jgi:hypothetical protein
MALSARPAADEHGPIPTLHPGILQRRRAPDDGLGDTAILCRVDGDQERGDRLRRAFMLPILEAWAEVLCSARLRASWGGRWCCGPIRVIE